ncbi:MAG: helix-turn-helix domain-containing protein [Clostridiales bacterium]|nr:helix-turn-helix domain-containing protein [Clostridiales bacterium]
MNNKCIYTPKEVSEILGIGITKIYELLQQDRIPNMRIDRKYLISKDALEKAFNITIN